MLSRSFHISNKLGKNPINIDNFDKESLRNEAFKINKSKYQDYKKEIEKINFRVKEYL